LAEKPPNSKLSVQHNGRWGWTSTTILSSRPSLIAAVYGRGEGTANLPKSTLSHRMRQRKNNPRAIYLNQKLYNFGMTARHQRKFFSPRAERGPGEGDG
jgi:hypothetical protein